VVADGVDAAVKRMEAPGAHAPGDRRGAEPDGDELPTRDDAALGAGENGDVLVWGDLSSEYRSEVAPRAVLAPWAQLLSG